MMTKKIILAATAASLFFGATAASADTESATATANILEAITVTKVNDLAFGTIVVGTTGGNVTMSNDGVDTRGCGTLTCSGTATAAEFTVDGTGDEAITVTVPATVVLSDGSDNPLTTTVDENNYMTATLSSNMAATDTIDSDGSSDLFVGGSLAVAGGQASGAYTGTFNVTVNY